MVLRYNDGDQQVKIGTCAACHAQFDHDNFPPRPPTKDCLHLPKTCGECNGRWVWERAGIDGWEGIRCPDCQVYMDQEDITVSVGVEPCSMVLFRADENLRNGKLVESVEQWLDQDEDDYNVQPSSSSQDHGSEDLGTDAKAQLEGCNGQGGGWKLKHSAALGFATGLLVGFVEILL